MQASGPQRTPTEPSPTGRRAENLPLRLLRASQVFAPAALGPQDILIGGGQILALGPDLSAVLALHDLVDVQILPKGRLIPGLVDQHVHFLGGGDGDGPDARKPEMNLADFAAGGVTTAVGLLGSDVDTKTLAQLLRKTRELDRGGMSAFMYTGAMGLPAPFLTSGVRSDVVLIDKVVGAKSAIGERTAPNLDFSALAALAGSLVLAKGMSGKAAVLHLHVGRLKSGMEMLFELVERIDFPPSQAVPSHINRAPKLFPVFEQGVRFAKLGGNIDFTCCLGPLDGLPSGLDPVEAVLRALDAGVPPDRITLSSDAGVAVPDGRGGSRAVPAYILYRDLLRLVSDGGLGWPQALAFVTENVARVLGLGASKGAIAPGMDADLVLVGEDNQIIWTLCKGRVIFDRDATTQLTHERKTK